MNPNKNLFLYSMKTKDQRQKTKDQRQKTFLLCPEIGRQINNLNLIL